MIDIHNVEMNGGEVAYKKGCWIRFKYARHEREGR